MKKKFLIGLAPLVVVTAFLVIPAASQAVPHVYRNGVKSAEGTKLRTLTWGVFHLSNATTGEVECHAALPGFLENPTGGGQATGQVQAFSPYECVSNTCIGQGGKFVEVTTEHLPWTVELTEPSAGVFRQKIGVKGEKGGKGSAELFYNCEGVTKVHPFGENSPLFLNNGLSIGATPGEIEFDPGSAEFESEIGGFKTAAKLKTMGFSSQDLLKVKNP